MSESRCGHPDEGTEVYVVLHTWTVGDASWFFLVWSHFWPFRWLKRSGGIDSFSLYAKCILPEHKIEDAMMAETRTVHDPFVGTNVQVSDRLVDRLRGKYASGPHLPNGNPEFGWKQFQAPPIQHEAADRIEKLEWMLRIAGYDAAQIAAGTPYIEVMGS